MLLPIVALWLCDLSACCPCLLSNGCATCIHTFVSWVIRSQTASLYAVLSGLRGIEWINSVTSFGLIDCVQVLYSSEKMTVKISDGPEKCDFICLFIFNQPACALYTSVSSHTLGTSNSNVSASTPCFDDLMPQVRGAYYLPWRLPKHIQEHIVSKFEIWMTWKILWGIRVITHRSSVTQ